MKTDKDKDKTTWMFTSMHIYVWSKGYKLTWRRISHPILILSFLTTPTGPRPRVQLACPCVFSPYLITRGNLISRPCNVRYLADMKLVHCMAVESNGWDSSLGRTKFHSHSAINISFIGFYPPSPSLSIQAFYRGYPKDMHAWDCNLVRNGRHGSSPVVTWAWNFCHMLERYHS